MEISTGDAVLAKPHSIARTRTELASREVGAGILPVGRTPGGTPDRPAMLATRDQIRVTAARAPCAMLLEWMGARHRNNALGAAAKRIEAAVDAALKDPATRTVDLGGKLGTREFSGIVAARLG